LSGERDKQQHVGGGKEIDDKREGEGKKRQGNLVFYSDSFESRGESRNDQKQSTGEEGGEEKGSGVEGERGKKRGLRDF